MVEYLSYNDRYAELIRVSRMLNEESSIKKLIKKFASNNLN
jgi:hypothetical protein